MTDDRTLSYMQLEQLAGIRYNLDLARFRMPTKAEGYNSSVKQVLYSRIRSLSSKLDELTGATRIDPTWKETLVRLDLHSDQLLQHINEFRKTLPNEGR